MLLINNDNSDVYNLVILEKNRITVNNLHVGVIYASKEIFELIEKLSSNEQINKISAGLDNNFKQFNNTHIVIDKKKYNDFKVERKYPII